MNKKPKELSLFEYSMLIGAIRYYEYGATIASATFPEDVVKHYFNGAYDKNSCDRIARQVVEVDHRDGESDWSERKYGMTCDNKPWCMFYAFLKAWLKGFANITASNGKKPETVEAFFCEYTGNWHPKNHYISGGIMSSAYIPQKYIKKIVYPRGSGWVVNVENPQGNGKKK